MKVLGVILAGFVGLILVGNALREPPTPPKAGKAEAARFCNQSWEDRKFQLIFALSTAPWYKTLHPDDRLSFARRFGLEQYGCAF